MESKALSRTGRQGAGVLGQPSALMLVLGGGGEEILPMEPMPCLSYRVKMNLSCLALESLFGPQGKSRRDTRLAAPGPTGFLPAHSPCPPSWAPGTGRERGVMAKMIPGDSGDRGTSKPHLEEDRTFRNG